MPLLVFSLTQGVERFLGRYWRQRELRVVPLSPPCLSVHAVVPCGKTGVKEEPVGVPSLLSGLSVCRVPQALSYATEKFMYVFNNWFQFIIGFTSSVSCFLYLFFEMILLSSFSTLFKNELGLKQQVHFFFLPCSDWVRPSDSHMLIVWLHIMTKNVFLIRTLISLSNCWKLRHFV